MTFKRTYTAIITTALLMGTTSVFAASAGAGEVASVDAASVAAHPMRTVRLTDGRSVQIDLVPGDKRAEFDKMIALHMRVEAHGPLNVSSDLEVLAKTFKEGSIQFNILYVLSCVAEQLQEPGTTAAVYDGLAGDIEVAACLFRFFKPGGMVIPGYLPNDEQYEDRVIQIAFSEQLSKWTDMLYPTA